MIYVVQETSNSFNNGRSHVVEAPNQDAAFAFGNTCGYNEWNLRAPNDGERAKKLTRERIVKVGEVEFTVKY